MSDSVIITIVVAVAVVIVLYIFRDRLSKFSLRADSQGVQTELTAHQEESAPAPNQPPARPGVEISGNVMKGQRHKISARRDASVRENLMEGRDHEIDAGE
jgi:hypothetical protein